MNFSTLDSLMYPDFLSLTWICAYKKWHEDDLVDIDIYFCCEEDESVMRLLNVIPGAYQPCNHRDFLFLSYRRSSASQLHPGHNYWRVKLVPVYILIFVLASIKQGP